MGVIGSSVNIENGPVEGVSTLEEFYNAVSFDAQLNEQTVKYFKEKWLANANYNQRYVEFYKDIKRLFGRDRSTETVVLAGAGPSLDRLKDMLRVRRLEFKIMAVDAALWPLLEGGIKPDWVFTVDSDIIAANFFEGVTERGLQLIGSILSHPYVYERWHGGIYVFCPVHYRRVSDMGRPVCMPGPEFLKDSDIFSYIHQTKFPRMTGLCVNFNVSATALNLCQAMKFGKIILAGVDYCFWGGRYYCQGVRQPQVEIDTEEKLKAYYGKSLFEFEYKGEKVWTSDVMVRYAAAQERFLDMMPGNVINVSCPLYKKYPIQSLERVLEESK